MFYSNISNSLIMPVHVNNYMYYFKYTVGVTILHVNVGGHVFPTSERQ